MEQPYMLLILYCQYHAYWCTGSLSRIDQIHRNIPSLVLEELIFSRGSDLTSDEGNFHVRENNMDLVVRLSVAPQDFPEFCGTLQRFSIFLYQPYSIRATANEYTQSIGTSPEFLYQQVHDFCHQTLSDWCFRHSKGMCASYCISFVSIDSYFSDRTV